MIPWLAAGLFGIALVLPALAGPRLERAASPAQMLTFSLAALSALALGLIVSLTAVVDAASVPAIEVPELVGRCVEAAARLFAHPLGHWPQIAAALILLFVVGRLAFALVIGIRNARQEVRAIVRLVGTEAWSDPRRIVVVPGEHPLALTAGFVHPRIIVSDGLLRSLDAAQRRAVIAHERRHARGHDVWMLLVARVVARALSFVPSIRTATDQLILGLELRADEAAARRVGDPLIVAQALVRIAHGAATDLGATTLGAARTKLGVRVDRLLAGDATRGRRGRRIGRSLPAAAALGLVLAFVLLLVPSGGAWALGSPEPSHAVCHLPHAGAGTDRDLRSATYDAR